MGKLSKLILCPNLEKERILKSFSHGKELQDVSFLTKEEYYQRFFFSYDERAIYYLMKKYHYQYDVCEVYLKSLYGLEDKTYKSEKLLFLQNLKKELEREGLLTFHPSFRDSLSKKEICVSHYYELDLWEEKALNYAWKEESISFSHPVYAFSTLEEEVNYVCLKIIELLKQGVDISSVYLCNVGEDYYYTIEKLFSYYHIPINIPYQNSIYGNPLVQDYLKTGEMDLSNTTHPVLQQLVTVLNSLAFVDLEDPVGRELLIEKLKRTYYRNPIMEPAVSICDLFSRSFSEDQYVFVLGLNQDVLPSMKKDVEFISDLEKDEYLSYPTSIWNRREKQIVAAVLGSIPNLFLSFKRTTPFAKFYPSSFIDEYGLEVIEGYPDFYQHSHLYNQLRLGEKLDSYRLFGEKKDYLSELLQEYSIPYYTYSNQFSGINLDTYLTHLDYPLKLSYTSFNSYRECKFQYYLHYVLKMDSFVDSFPAFIGSLFHKILSLCYYPNFSFEEEYRKYLENRECSLKEKILLVRIKKELVKLIDILKKQQLLTGYDNFLFEKKIEIPIREDISVLFVGYLDKILYYQKVEDTYFSIVDYKTGTIDTHLEPMKYGLHMQLPVYLYLIHYGKVFQNPIFTGIYYQNILFDYPKWDEAEDSSKRFYLDGYSTDDSTVLRRFDSTYENSEYIKSMKYSDEKGFDRFSKVLSNDQLFDMLQYTKGKIEESVDDILKGDFSIHPLIYGKESPCMYCTFRDICYHKETDSILLEKVDDLSFLGGE